MKLSGITCGGCTGTVTHALQAGTGVGDVKVSLSAGEAAVQFDGVALLASEMSTVAPLLAAVEANRGGR